MTFSEKDLKDVDEVMAEKEEINKEKKFNKWGVFRGPLQSQGGTVMGNTWTDGCIDFAAFPRAFSDNLLDVLYELTQWYYE